MFSLLFDYLGDKCQIAADSLESSRVFNYMHEFDKAFIMSFKDYEMQQILKDSINLNIFNNLSVTFEYLNDFFKLRKWSKLIEKV